MKKELIILSLLLLSLFSCKKEEIVIYNAGPQEYGWATALKYGEEWNASTWAKRSSLDSNILRLSFTTYSIDGAIRESVSFGIPFKEGFYDTAKFLEDDRMNMGGGIRGSDGDVSEATYSMDEDKDSYIYIAKLDSVEMTVAGSFRAFFKKRENASDHPGKLELTEGVFQTVIIE